jgi:cytochrome-b5 reductase
LREKIEEYAKKYSNFHYYHCLNQPLSKDWNQGVGFITPEMIQEKCPFKPCPENKMLLCGPPPMIKAMTGNLEKIGYTKEDYFLF